MGSSCNLTGKVHTEIRHSKILSLWFWSEFFSLFLSLFSGVRRVGKSLVFIVACFSFILEINEQPPVIKLFKMQEKQTILCYTNANTLWKQTANLLTTVCDDTSIIHYLFILDE